MLAKTEASGGEHLHPEVLAFSSSLELDKKLLHEDLLGSLAHLTMLSRQGIIPKAAAAKVKAGLLDIWRSAQDGSLRLPEEEDVHMAVEAELSRRIGEPAGLLHTSRSRNDQVALDLRLHVRAQLAKALLGLADFIELLAARAEGWELGTVEAPALVPGPDGRLHLLYSGGNFESAYATGYAICPRDLGTCERVGDRPWLENTPPNPGGLDVARDEDGTLHGIHHGGPVSLREPYLVPLSWQ